MDAGGMGGKFTPDGIDGSAAVDASAGIEASTGVTFSIGVIMGAPPITLGAAG